MDGSMTLGGVLEFTGLPHAVILADDQGNGLAADINSGDLDVRFCREDKPVRMGTWFPDPEPAFTDLVSAGSRAWFKASDSLRYRR